MLEEETVSHEQDLIIRNLRVYSPYEITHSRGLSWVNEIQPKLHDWVSEVREDFSRNPDECNPQLQCQQNNCLSDGTSKESDFSGSAGMVGRMTVTFVALTISCGLIMATTTFLLSNSFFWAFGAYLLGGTFGLSCAVLLAVMQHDRLYFTS